MNPSRYVLSYDSDDIPSDDEEEDNRLIAEDVEESDD